MPPGQELAKLSECMHPANIPKKYGGEMEYEFGMPPDLDPEIRELVKWEDEERKGLPVGPTRWVRREDGQREVVSVGSKDGKERREKVFTLL